MSQFIIDAPLLACPDPNQSSKEDFQKIFINYLSRLTDLAMLRSGCASIRFWRDEFLPVVLEEQNCFPFRHSLVHAFSQLFDPMEFQLEDINVLATALLERSMSIDEFGEIKDIVVSACSLEEDPVANRCVPFLDHLCRAVALALPILGNGKDFGVNTFLASCGEHSSSDRVVANYTIDVAESRNGEIHLDLGPTSVKLANYRGSVSLFKEANLAAWWSISTDEAVRDVCAIHTAANQADPWQIISSVRDALSIGADFISSAQPLGFMHDERKINRLLRACAELLSGNNMAASHWLRVGKGGNDKQRSRDHWRAWRHDIDNEFHLHYWRYGTRIEIANVVVHSDFNISD